MPLFELAAQNLLSPMVLFFALGLAMTFARSDLAIPGAISKFLSLYLMMSIGFRGGAEVAHSGLSGQMVATIGAGLFLSFTMPLVAFAFLRRTTGLAAVDAAAVAAHYGSISAVTLVAVTGALTQLGIPYEGYMVAVAAVMETPAILSALMLVRRDAFSKAGGEIWREILLNGAVVMLLGSFAIGVITGPRGLETLKPFIAGPFAGFLCFFLLDLGLVAGRGLKEGWRALTPMVMLFAVVMPLIGCAAAAAFACAIGLSIGGSAVLMTLAASASYIAVPAALRMVLPEANPAIPLTLSLGITFPLNLIFGIPLYIALAGKIAS